MLTSLHVRGRDHRGRSTDRSGRVHTEHRLADRTQRVGEVQLRLHHALEDVGRLSEHDSINVGHCHLSVVKGSEHGLAHEAAEGHVETTFRMLGLAHANYRARDHDGPSRMQIRFCCRHGPLVAWANARAPPSRM